MSSDTGADRLSKAILAEAAPCDGCDLKLWCMQEMACETFAFYCGFFSSHKEGVPDRTIEDCGTIPSRAMYLRIYPSSGEYAMGMENVL